MLEDDETTDEVHPDLYVVEDDDIPEKDSGDVEELEGGDQLDETESGLSPFREITEEEMEEGRLLGEDIDPEDELSGTEDEEAE